MSDNKCKPPARWSFSEKSGHLTVDFSVEKNFKTKFFNKKRSQQKKKLKMSSALPSNRK